MHLLAKERGHQLQAVLQLPTGTPFADTFERVFKRLNPSSLQECFAIYEHDILSFLAEKQIVLDGKKLKLVRGHWSIENKLLWHLDVTFKEDACRARTGNAPENLSIITKIALQMIENCKDKLSLKKRQYMLNLMRV